MIGMLLLVISAVVLGAVNLWLLLDVCLAVNEIQRELIRLRIDLVEAVVWAKGRQEQGFSVPPWIKE